MSPSQRSFLGSAATRAGARRGVLTPRAALRPEPQRKDDDHAAT